MFTWLRSLALLLGMMCAVGVAIAQGLTDAQLAQMEKEADDLYTRGEGRMKVASYEEAIGEFRNVLMRYPLTQTRYKAQFRMADALVALKKESDAIALLQSVVKEENPDWSPKALMRIGDISAAQQRYAEAFGVYKDVVLLYPTSPTVDRAYFAIGSLHFKLGHFEQAAKDLDKVGTVYAATIPELKHVSPGEPLYIRLDEPNMVANDDTNLKVTLTTKTGDTEEVTLKAEVVDGEFFGASVQTALGDPKPKDGILQMYGNDVVTLSYQSRYVGAGATTKTIPMTICSNGRIIIRDSEEQEVRGVVVGDTIYIEIRDPDRDTTDNPDTITAELKTKGKDTEKLTLTETGKHTGIFRIPMKLTKGDPTPDSKAVETNAGIMEGTATQYDDNIVITYMDEVNLSVEGTGPRKVTMTVNMFASTEGVPGAPTTDDTTKQADDIKTRLYKGRSMTQIAATYRDLGQDALAYKTFTKAADEMKAIITKYPNAPEVEDAMYGLFQNYVEMDMYESAIGVVNQITRKFPESTRAAEALFQLAKLHVRREEYDRALAIYQTLANTAKGTPIAEEATYNICTTYMEMYKPKAGRLGPPPVSRDQVAASLEEFVRNYPRSEQAPEALWQLVRFRYEGEDYRGAIDAARRMSVLFADNVMTGRVLLLQGQAQVKLREYDAAIETFQTIIMNYGPEAEQAQRLLNEVLRKTGGPKKTGTEGA